MPVVLSPNQQTALTLYDLGLNIFPQPIGKKGGLPWKALQFIRLDRDDPAYGLTKVFAGNSNLAVMCGRTSGNLFVIDCESPATLRYHMQQLRQRQIPLWVVQTARGGHIYLRAAEGEVHNIAPGILKDAEIKGQMGYVLAPPSVHPSGAIYTWLHQEGDNIPVVSVGDVDWLRNQTGDSVTLQVNTSQSSYTAGVWRKPHQPQKQLSRTTQEYLQQGHQLPEGSRNNRLFAAACDLAGNGYSEQHSLQMLSPIATGSGLEEREVRTTITSAYSKPRTPSRQHNISVVADDRWWKMLLWVTKQQWQSRTGATDRVMMLALIERARVYSNENGVFRASIREL
ncbi:MAG: bifunctional DNA primase/polymerase, partial [Anaerolineae bacterium]|nr:bifunctional DNA primase/polymerase [Anaerolineae bacterium]